MSQSSTIDTRAFEWSFPHNSFWDCTSISIYLPISSSIYPSIHWRLLLLQTLQQKKTAWTSMVLLCFRAAFAGVTSVLFIFISRDFFFPNQFYTSLYFVNYNNNNKNTLCYSDITYKHIDLRCPSDDTSCSGWLFIRNLVLTHAWVNCFGSDMCIWRLCWTIQVIFWQKRGVNANKPKQFSRNFAMLMLLRKGSDLKHV